MIAVDTNILVYAHRKDSDRYQEASRVIKELSESKNSWFIPWPVIHEFFAIVTHPKIYRPASTKIQAIHQINVWLKSPSVVLGSETDDYWDVLEKTLENSNVIGPAIHDARIAAICATHRVKVLYSADRDFSRFSELKVENPL